MHHSSPAVSKQIKMYTKTHVLSFYENLSYSHLFDTDRLCHQNGKSCEEV